jgi:hypothetical protein
VLRRCTVRTSASPVRLPFLVDAGARAVLGERKEGWLMRTLLVLAGLAVPMLGHAQVADHLKCYAIKDSLRESGANPAKTYTADLNGLTPEPGCVIKMPAKYACVETTKTNVQPTPPGAADGSAAARFLCYKVKCAKATPPAITLADQFGTRAITVRRAKLLCAPASVPTTSTTTTITTTTEAGSTTIVTVSSTSCPVATAAYCGGADCGLGGMSGVCNIPPGPTFGLCPQGTTCTATEPGSAPTSHCACVGDEIPCGDPRLSGITCNFCKWGTCPPGMVCGGVPKNGACGYDCTCVPE